MGFMPTETNRAIGSLDYSNRERRDLARKSRLWRCETCGPIKDLLNSHNDSSINENNTQSITNRDINRLSTSNKVNVDKKELTDANKTRIVDTTDTKPNDNRSPNDNVEPNLLKNHSKNQIINEINGSHHNTAQTNLGSEQINHPSTYNHQDSMTVDDLGPSTGNIVLKSIFVLLLVLLFRRILMIAQIA